MIFAPGQLLTYAGVVVQWYSSVLAFRQIPPRRRLGNLRVLRTHITLATNDKPDCTE